MMKDITISGKVLKRELLIVLGCLVAAIGVNIYSIIKYHTPFYEVFTQVGFTLVVMLIILAEVSIIRLIVYLLKKLFTRK